MVKIAVKLLRVLGYVWVILATLLTVASLVMIGLKEGFSAVCAVMSPFNVLNYLVMIVLFAPGLGALVLADKVEQREP